MGTTNKLRVWELSLMVGLAFSILSGLWVNGQQLQLAEQVVRLHVIAHSDSDVDQSLKLLVRDEILSATTDFIPSGTSLEDAQTLILQHLPTLAQVGADVVAREGFSYSVSASLEPNVWFPTKDYDSFSLPAGDYTALRIQLGDAQGENWWCVVFPPLCHDAVTETAVAVSAFDAFSDSDLALITGETDGYTLKFKSMELWDSFKGWAEDHWK